MIRVEVFWVLIPCSGGGLDLRNVGILPQTLYGVTTDVLPSCQVILLLKISQSVSPSWLRAPNSDSRPYSSLEGNFSIVFRGVSTLTGGRGCHVQVSQSVSVLFVCLSRFDIIIVSSSITIIIMYKGYMYMPGMSVRVRAVFILRFSFVICQCRQPKVSFSIVALHLLQLCLPISVIFIIVNFSVTGTNFTFLRLGSVCGNVVTWLLLYILHQHPPPHFMNTMRNYRVASNIYLKNFLSRELSV
jgi:hypothetical protein